MEPDRACIMGAVLVILAIAVIIAIATWPT